jgi:hypothetical protein
MKSSRLMLTVGSTAAMAGLAWLAWENARLRDQLAQSAGNPAPPSVQHASSSSVASASPSLPGGLHPIAGDRLPGKGLPRPRPASGTVSASSHNPSDGHSPSVSSSPGGGVVLHDPLGGPDRHLAAGEARQLTQQIQSALAEQATSRPNGPSWSPGQAAGPPNTETHGDFSTAWASQTQDGGAEWLKVKYKNPVEISEINIHESYNPGAIAKVSVIQPDGGQKVIWEGVASPETGLIERSMKVPPGIRSDQVLIEMDTARVPGWNEIDAVEIVGRDGSRQWGAESTASSYFGEGSTRRQGSGSIELGGADFLTF